MPMNTERMPWNFSIIFFSFRQIREQHTNIQTDRQTYIQKDGTKILYDIGCPVSFIICLITLLPRFVIS